MHKEFDQDLEIIRRGVEEIIPEEGLIQKLALSRQSGVPLRIKYGIDPTGADVHLGHLVPIRKMRDFQDLGHLGIIIIGDFTAQIGDPTGRDDSRPPLSREEVLANSERYMEQLYTVLNPERTEVRYQSEWFGTMGMSEVLQLLGKFTLAQFMAHDTFRNRYEQGLALGMHELMYPLLQGYDSVAIRSDIELGATEQKFNILAGRDLQRYFGQSQQLACLSPILMGTDGTNKMSKSLGNYIAIFDPPREKYGKVMSIPDSLILNYFCYATTIPLSEIEKMKQELAKGMNPMQAKKRLAWEIVKLYHGTATAEDAQQAFEQVFSKKAIPDEMPVFRVPEGGIGIVILLVSCGACTSNSEAKRLIDSGAISIDGIRIQDVTKVITPVEGAVLKAGKRKFYRLAGQNEQV
ncbi:MAG: tyrosine--tRNA ligase [Candidatus Cloacimonetes bacterium]|nr:tyrosine--tRNA ligase [Candidatus Cloacimonadota bacterium]